MKSYLSIFSLTFLFILASNSTLNAQNESNFRACGFNSFPLLDTISAPKDYDNIAIKSLCSDSLASSYVIWIKEGVKAHKHIEHSETIVVIDGTAEMRLNDEWYSISKGMYIFIPFNSVHAVRVTSDEPLKVLSIQAPEFKGKDRVFVE